MCKKRLTQFNSTESKTEERNGQAEGVRALMIW